jgi:hypothetical protein
VVIIVVINNNNSDPTRAEGTSCGDLGFTDSKTSHRRTDKQGADSGKKDYLYNNIQCKVRIKAPFIRAQLQVSKHVVKGFALLSFRRRSTNPSFQK